MGATWPRVHLPTELSGLILLAEGNLWRLLNRRDLIRYLHDSGNGVKTRQVGRKLEGTGFTREGNTGREENSLSNLAVVKGMEMRDSYGR